jgi:glycosyltransferase involved in cell wall biosynthesis
VKAAAPTVTCIIPVYNGESFLGPALDSVFAQSRPPEEVIVVDDGSTDGGADLARSYGDRVRVLTQSHAGPGAARNHGVAAAHGDLICFLDDDDLFVPAKQERQLGRFAARPDLEISLCVYEMFWEPGLEHEEGRYRALGRHRGTHALQTMLARRSVFEKAGPFHPSLTHGNHIEWFARVRDGGVVSEVLEEVLVRRRMHAASFSHREPGLDDYVNLVKDRLDRLRGA